VAEKYYEYVKTKFPFLDAAKMAELRLCDVSFQRELWTEAADRCTAFVKLHPTHPKVDYAAYHAALAHYRDMPVDWFMIPSSSEKDQTQVRAAYTALNDFVKTYPDSQYRPEAQKQLAEVRKRLAEHEISVADFYEKRNRWAAAVNRRRPWLTSTRLRRRPGALPTPRPLRPAEGSGQAPRTRCSGSSPGCRAPRRRTRLGPCWNVNPRIRGARVRGTPRSRPPPAHRLRDVGRRA
jgi:hypothetical protein